MSDYTLEVELDTMPRGWVCFAIGEGKPCIAPPPVADEIKSLVSRLDAATAAAEQVGDQWRAAEDRAKQALDNWMIRSKELDAVVACVRGEAALSTYCETVAYSEVCALLSRLNQILEVIRANAGESDWDGLASPRQGPGEDFCTECYGTVATGHKQPCWRSFAFPAPSAPSETKYVGAADQHLIDLMAAPSEGEKPKPHPSAIDHTGCVLCDGSGWKHILVGWEDRLMPCSGPLRNGDPATKLS